MWVLFDKMNIGSLIGDFSYVVVLYIDCCCGIYSFLLFFSGKNICLWY